MMNGVLGGQVAPGNSGPTPVSAPTGQQFGRVTWTSGAFLDAHWSGTHSNPSH